MSDVGRKQTSGEDGSMFLFAAATFCVVLHVLAAFLPHLAVFMLPLLLLASLAPAIFIVAGFVHALRREKMLLQAVLLIYGLVIITCWAAVISAGRWE